MRRIVTGGQQGHEIMWAISAYNYWTGRRVPTSIAMSHLLEFHYVLEPARVITSRNGMETTNFVNLDRETLARIPKNSTGVGIRVSTNE
jgi:hypothetical protein